MGTKMTVKDTLTKYINDVIKLVDDESNTRKFLETTGQELHFNNISEFIPQWNPNLIMSPMERDNQIYEVSNELSVLELVYTGFTRREELIDVWWEFSDDMEQMRKPDERELERDYAYYQETGIDSIANPKGGGKAYVFYGTHTYSSTYKLRVNELMYNWLRLKRWKSSNVKSLTKMENSFGFDISEIF